MYWIHQQGWLAENVCFTRNEIQVFVQEWSKELCYLFDYSELNFKLPPTSLHYSKSWWSQALLCHLKSFWDTCAKWFWWTEGQVWILDQLHATGNNTSSLKSCYISCYICETSKVSKLWGQGIWGAIYPSILHPRWLFWTQANAESLNQPATAWC